MKRIVTAVNIVILFPVIVVTALYIICKSVQPITLELAGTSQTASTSYFDETKYYGLSGSFLCVPKVISTPIAASEVSTGPASFAQRISDGHEVTVINDFSEIKSTSCVLEDNYVATFGFTLRLPTNTDYALWFPEEFCNYRIFINGETASVSASFGKRTPIYPRSFYVKLPASETGYYEVVANIISPTNYYNTGLRSILIGSYEKISHSFESVKKVSLFFASYIIFTMIFTLVQLLAIRKDKRMLPFIFFSGMTGIVMSFMDGRSILQFIPILPYNVGVVIEALATPLYLLTLLFFTEKMFSEYFPKKISSAFIFALLIPFVNALTLNKIPYLPNVASFLMVIPYAICLYVFVLVFEKQEPHALAYGIAVLSIESSVLLFQATRDMLVPSRFAYSIGYTILSVTVVSILACEYSKQSTDEAFYSDELTRQLEAMQASENAFLNAQMKPHFLYNTLNTIADCCVTDSPKAKKLINSLSEYLKLILSLDNMDKTVPLRRELELVEAYTDIEKERFPNINFYNDFPIRMPGIMMPPITIQPLIENAIKHGVRKLDKPGVVTLRIVENSDSVDFFVSDNGIGMEQETINNLFAVPKENKSIGIYNIDKRLKNQYGKGLHVESTPGLGTCISFTIPKTI